MAAGGSSDRPPADVMPLSRMSQGLLTDAAGYPLAEQIGVTEVACVLLDHVQYHLAQRDGRAIVQRDTDGEAAAVTARLPSNRYRG
jgi:hypothetical protein